MSQLDAYVESVLSRMGLEGAQREEMEKELRAPLERAVNAYLGRRLTREQAEQNAIRAAHKSSFLFKCFGILRDHAWVYFLYIAGLLYLAFLLPVCIATAMATEDRNTYLVFFSGRTLLLSFAFIAIMVWIDLFLHMFKRVEIKGGLYVRRFLRKPHLVPLDKITRVRFSLVPLVRPRGIVIESPEKRAVINRKFHGFPGAALALHAFSSDKIDADVRQCFMKAERRICVPVESLSLRPILTLLWALVLAGFFIFIGNLWQGIGLSLPLAAVFLAAFILMLFQVLLHAETAKKAVSLLLVVTILLALLESGSGCFFGDAARARWASAAACAMFAGAVVLLWWRWSRVVLLGLFLACAALFVSSRYALPSLYYKELKPLIFERTPDFPVNTQIVGPEGPVVWTDWYKENSSENGTRLFKAAYPDGKFRSVEIEESGYWQPMTPTPFREPCLLRMISHDTTSTCEVHIYNQDISEVKKVIPLPRDTNPYGLDSPMYPVWSPDGKYLITRIVEHNETSEYKMQAVNIQNASTASFQEIWSPFRWVDNRTIEGRLSSRDETHDDEAASTRPKSIDIWQIDVKNGSQELVVRRELSGDEDYGAVFPGVKYAFISTYKSLDPSDELQGRPPESCSIMNIKTGEALNVPVPKEWTKIYELTSRAWSEEKEIFTYIANPENQDEGERIITVDLKSRSIRARKFPPNVRIANIRLSPDGKKILFICSMEKGLLLKLFSRLDLWDLRTDEIIPVRSLGVFRIFLALDSYPRWSPDSSWFVYPFVQDRIKGPCLTIEVAKVP